MDCSAGFPTRELAFEFFDIFLEFDHLSDDFFDKPELAFHTVFVSEAFSSGQMVVDKDFPDLIGIMFNVFGAFKGCNFIG